jgi:hypothetical protein
MADDHNDRHDAFSSMIGRALIDHPYRDRLMDGNDAERIEAMVDAGLTPEEAEAALHDLGHAVDSLKALHAHDAFGPVRPAAA